ncbi:transposase [Spirosoma foliorum]|uniref:Transposase n=1 Tax=Spirosoma foliorum TaxID=2710596 RepID=A0A7G5H7B1_9BACT|nr:transposase [Spirosoma foliorum]
MDLLEGRTAEGLRDWLRAHPGVEVITRDCSGEYAWGAREGAPQAQQVADRWHLLQNLEQVVGLRPMVINDFVIYPLQR